MWKLVVVVLGLLALQAVADPKSDRAAIVDGATKLSTSAATLGKAAKASDDRGARKKFAPAAVELGDDLAAFARRAAKDVALKSLAKDMTDLVKDAHALVELADEAEDKEDRKTLRAQAVLLEQGVAGLGTQLVAAAQKEEAKPVPAKRFNGRIFNNTDKCSWGENLKFVVSRDGQTIGTTGLVFPGKNYQTVLEEGKYLVQILETNGDFLAQKTVEVKAEGWQFFSGCVKD